VVRGLLRICPNIQDLLLPALGEGLRQVFPGPDVLLRSVGMGWGVVLVLFFESDSEGGDFDAVVDQECLDITALLLYLVV
ncbi:hypothetical protein, partial [Pseudomonas aeruginosa]|uniref:hypothetical protein n=1 Tax=Pseudomonas aeruginosa TaxID=287 RepID=UPI003CC64261